MRSNLSCHTILQNIRICLTWIFNTDCHNINVLQTYAIFTDIAETKTKYDIVANVATIWSVYKRFSSRIIVLKHEHWHKKSSLIDVFLYKGVNEIGHMYFSFATMIDLSQSIDDCFQPM